MKNKSKPSEVFNPVGQQHLAFLQELKELLKKHKVAYFGTGGGTHTYVAFQDEEEPRISDITYHPSEETGGDKTQPLRFSYYESRRM